MPDLSPEALSPFLRESGLVFENMTRTEVTGTIDAGPDHHTPWGVVHGGLYATAVESTTSVGASLAVADEGMFAVGLTNQTDFIRAHTEGRLHVNAWPIHQGRTGQLWQCDSCSDRCAAPPMTALRRGDRRRAELRECD